MLAAADSSIFKSSSMSSSSTLPAGTVKRLMITKMVMENFKSYGGRKEIGPFHKRFSSVVGPNGSGKSNVIDAMLFVFGKRAAQMRLKKLPELIHKSDAYPDLEQAEVAVHFQEIIDYLDDDDKFDVVPNSQFVLSRTAHKSGASNYYLNERKINWTEATELLMGKGIDLEHNRFLILQGEVEQISLMKPKAPSPNEDGLLEYLEDIIGSHRFVSAIEEASKAVDTLNEQRQEKLNRVKLVEKDKDNLEGAKAEAEKFLARERDLNLRRVQLYQIFKYTEDKSCLELTKKAESARTKSAAAQTALVEHEATLAQSEAAYNAGTAEHAKVVNTMKQCKEDFAKIERRDVKNREELKNEKAKEKKAQATVVSTKAKITELEATAAAAEASIPDLQRRAAALNEQKVAEEATLESMFEKLKTTTGELRASMEAQQKKLVPLRKAVNAAQSKVEIAEGEITMFEERGNNARTQLTAAQRSLAEHQADGAKNVQAVSTSEQAVNTQKARLAAAQRELTEVVAQENEANERLSSTRAKLEDARAAAASSGRASSSIADAFTKLRKTKEFAGVHGRLGDLGSIDDKYDVAVSTAAAALNHIVVDTVETAQRCVEHLRANNLGKATFICLDKLAYLQAPMAAGTAAAANTPERVPRLFDLVQCKNDALKPAFYFAMRETLVADNLDQAVRIAYQPEKRLRVVTLDGQLIEATGTMSGGGAKKMSGAMKSSRGGASKDGGDSLSESELANLSNSHDALVEQLKNLKLKHRQLDQEIAALNRSIPAAELAARKASMAVQALSLQEAQILERIQAAQAALQPSPEEATRVAELKQELVGLRATAAEAKANAAALEAEIAALQQRILDAGGAGLRAQKAAVERLAASAEETAAAATKAGVDAAAARKGVEKAQKALAAAESEVAGCATKLEQLKADSRQVEEEALAINAACEAAQRELDERAAALQRITKEYEAVVKAVDKLRGSQVEIANELESSERGCKEHEKKSKHWQTKIVEAAAKVHETFPDTKIPLQDANGDAEMPDAEAKSPADLLSELPARDEVEYAITMLEAALSKMKPNMGTIEEYRRKEGEYSNRVKELDEITQSRDAQRRQFESLRKQRLDEFMSGFTTITLKLKEMYQMLTLGGDAELELVDSLDPFTEGIVFSVRPPKKSWKNISNLSGGEKTLSSLALVFALHHYKPTPLYVMDEIDAALDFKNVSIVANYIKERTKDAQFIIISLRNNMFEMADRLVGIYKTQNSSKSITINPHKFAAPAEAVEQAAV